MVEMRVRTNEYNFFNFRELNCIIGIFKDHPVSESIFHGPKSEFSHKNIIHLHSLTSVLTIKFNM